MASKKASSAGNQQERSGEKIKHSLIGIFMAIVGYLISDIVFVNIIDPFITPLIAGFRPFLAGITALVFMYPAWIYIKRKVHF